MFRQFSRIATKFHGTKSILGSIQARSITSSAARQKAAYAAQAYPTSHAYRETPSDFSVMAAGLVVIGFFGLQFWNCKVTANRISTEDFHFEAFEHAKPTLKEH